MYIADEVEFVRSTMACDFKENVANDQYGRPRTDIVHMQLVAMGKASAGAAHCAGAYGAGGRRCLVVLVLGLALVREASRQCR